MLVWKCACMGAARRFERAADLGHVDSTFSLAVAFENGNGAGRSVSNTVNICFHTLSQFHTHLGLFLSSALTPNTPNILYCTIPFILALA